MTDVEEVVDARRVANHLSAPRLVRRAGAKAEPPPVASMLGSRTLWLSPSIEDPILVDPRPEPTGVVAALTERPAAR